MLSSIISSFREAVIEAPNAMKVHKFRGEHEYVDRIALRNKYK
jgi:hypothetical protein